MNKEVFFTEKQRFSQWWIWTIMFLASVIPVWQVYYEITNNGKEIYTPTSYFGLVVVFLLIILLLSTKLETCISKEGINVRFIPFIWRQKTYRWDNLENVYIRDYKPIGEFGGWGVRGFRNNRALNISGNKGLQLVFKDGNRLLIGTQKANEIERVLKLLKKSEDE